LAAIAGECSTSNIKSRLPAHMVLRATGYRTVPTRIAFAKPCEGPRIGHAAVGALAITGLGRGGHVSIVAPVYPDGSFPSINGSSAVVG
jgi:hypothetical protein